MSFESSEVYVGATGTLESGSNCHSVTRLGAGVFKVLQNSNEAADTVHFNVKARKPSGDANEYVFTAPEYVNDGTRSGAIVRCFTFPGGVATDGCPFELTIYLRT